jgi:hypothetical protein
MEKVQYVMEHSEFPQACFTLFVLHDEKKLFVGKGTSVLNGDCKNINRFSLSCILWFWTYKHNAVVSDTGKVEFCCVTVISSLATIIVLCFTTHWLV